MNIWPEHYTLRIVLYVYNQHNRYIAIFRKSTRLKIIDLCGKCIIFTITQNFKKKTSREHEVKKVQ